jgi:glutamate racemase
VPIVGTVPAIKPAATMTETGTLGLLGTAATVRQKIAQFGQHCEAPDAGIEQQDRGVGFHVKSLQIGSGRLSKARLFS